MAQKKTNAKQPKGILKSLFDKHVAAVYDDWTLLQNKRAPSRTKKVKAPTLLKQAIAKPAPIEAPVISNEAKPSNS